MNKYTIGIDFGSLSARAVLADAENGHVCGTAVYEYPHAVMDKTLPDGTVLAPDSAFQHPQDYIDSFEATIPELLKQTGCSAKDIIGIGIDATSCTVLPVAKDGTPLCLKEKYSSEPQAYIKMWKHHAANEYAERLSAAAKTVCPEIPEKFGGNISAESFFPKLWEVLDRAPEVYREMDEYLEAGDWLVCCLTGQRVRNSCAAGYKAYYNGAGSGYPPEELFRAAGFQPGQPVTEKMPSPVIPIGMRAGGLLPDMAGKLHLLPGTPVAAAVLDAHVCAPAAGVASPGHMLMIMGTSACHMLLGTEEKTVSGICGAVKNGILPGYIGYEAGQSSVGDLFGWFIRNCVPPQTFENCAAANTDIHTYLSNLAAKKKAGETGLLALDWLNGNRSTLCDYDLSALLIGLNMQTAPEDIYRAFIEATAFGCRVIIENYRKNGVPVERLTVSGGISRKNPFAMQLYADILNMPVEVIDEECGPALGSAIFAAVAAGKAAGGYDTMAEAIQAMKSKRMKYYFPDSASASVYNRLYDHYCTLYELFGHGNIMRDLTKLRRHVAE